MEIEEKIDKILESQTEIKIDLAVIKTGFENHLQDFQKVKESHYKLRDDFKGLRSKVILIAGAIGSLFTLIGNWIYKQIFNA